MSELGELCSLTELCRRAIPPCGALAGHLLTAGPLGRRGSNVSQSSPRRTQLRHFGVEASHLTLRLRHWVQARERRLRFERGGRGGDAPSLATPTLLMMIELYGVRITGIKGQRLVQYWSAKVPGDVRDRSDATERAPTAHLYPPHGLGSRAQVA